MATVRRTTAARPRTAVTKTITELTASIAELDAKLEELKGKQAAFLQCSFVSQEVRHNTYGEGVIVEQNEDKFLALSSVYVLMRYLCLGINASAVDNIVDVVATIFRLVDHTDFDRYAAQILKRLDCESIGSICKIICL